MSVLNVSNLTVEYTNAITKQVNTAVKNASFKLETGQILALLGASGSGKSSLLRALAGLEQCTATDLSIGGLSFAQLPANKRGMGMVFQNSQLFPNYDVAGNIKYGLHGSGYSEQEKDAMVAEVLELVDLSGYESRKVQTLSGGQAQRVALARSLVTKPKVMLLDEPLSALDRSLREQLSTDLRTILKKSGTTAIYVTHDQDEAFTVGDLVGFMSDGYLRRIDTADEFYRHPKTVELATFLGYGPLLDNIAASYVGIFIYSNQYIAARPNAFSISRGDCARCGAIFSTVKTLKTKKGQLQALVELDAGVQAWIDIPKGYPTEVGDRLVLDLDKSKCTIVS